MPVHIFVGPTLSDRAVSNIVRDAVTHPPIAHGDLLRLAFDPRDVVVIVDGYYHQSASVRHKEILALLASGVRVVGCSSMGALRAAELHRYGMVGNGVVFDMFRDRVVDADDEVAVAHTPGPEYRVLSEPLIAVRHVVSVAERQGVLARDEATAIVTAARSLNYLRRSWRAIESAIARDHDELCEPFARLTSFRTEHRGELDIKSSDAVDTLRRLDDLVPVAPYEGPVVDEAVVDNSFLREWQANFRGASTHGVQVADGAVLRYQQVYRSDFPERWRRFVLSRVAACPVRLDEVGTSVEARALTAAAAQGLTPETISTAHEDQWLTRAERTHASRQQKLISMLVRSYRSLRPTYDLLIAEQDLVEEPAARQAVAEAMSINQEVASWANRWSVDHIKRETLLDHLAETWDFPSSDSDVLLAAARDRGFGSLDKAVDAVRPFYLRTHFRSIAGLPRPGG